MLKNCVLLKTTKTGFPCTELPSHSELNLLIQPDNCHVLQLAVKQYFVYLFWILFSLLHIILGKLII